MNIHTVTTVGENPHGWLFFKDGLWHWASEVPDGAIEARAATDWERYVFNHCNNRSDHILAILAPAL